jgi:serine/threonine protein kinase
VVHTTLSARFKTDAWLKVRTEGKILSARFVNHTGEREKELMSPETLIGVELGHGVLRRLLGQGTMGAVYLAEQAQTQRQVAVKVFLPASSLAQTDHEAFLARLKQEIAQSSLLTHPHILAVLDHGMHRDLVYTIMPYIAGETLQSQLDRSGALPFEQIQEYLEQMASALDYAHARGILHRDMKPANMLLAPDGNLLLTDFGLAGLTTEKNFAIVRRAVPGMLNYIAPEYVLGKAIDQRADLYALGVVLYQMVTGLPPFKGDSLGEVAIQHVKAIAPAPRSLRTELPKAAEQVILRALAKRPAERYSQAQDLASAFRLALEAAQLLPAANALEMLADMAGSNATTVPRLPAVRGGSLFDPKWQDVPPTPILNAQPTFNAVPPTPILPPDLETGRSPMENRPVAAAQIWGEPTGKNELNQPDRANRAMVQENTFDRQEPQHAGLLNFSPFQNGSLTQYQSQNAPSQTANGLFNQPERTEELRTKGFQVSQGTTGMLGALAAFPTSTDTNTGTIKLTEPVKVVQVPVAGQPGRFVTGYLPLLPTDEQTAIHTAAARARQKSKRLKIASLALIFLVVIVSSGVFLLAHNSKSNSATQKALITTNPGASATAHATATMGANIILSDSLSENIHNWEVGSHGNAMYTFQGGAYHIKNDDPKISASALLTDETLHNPFTYSLTMEQISGDMTSPNNQFGLILDATVQTTNGKQIDKFYAFEVLNKASGQYQFWKYDNSVNSNSPWTELWHKGFGKEFLQGNGPKHANTLKVVATGKGFTFIVNGTQITTSKDSSFSSGSVGMMVNLNKSEVAFSNLLLTYS